MTELFKRSFVFALGIVLPPIVYSPLSQASTISFSSVASNWLVSGAGALNDVPFQTTVNHLSITSNQTVLAPS
jgi:hypothetical protein